jgi:DNA-directed RNA polymerase II subunit RPB2
MLVALKRRKEDDRDHYANKRLDLGGPLLAQLFRQLFRKLVKDVKTYVQKCVDNGKEINLPFAVKTGTITKGLKYSLATGNWGQQGTQGLRAGVSQVRGSVRFMGVLWAACLACYASETERACSTQLLLLLPVFCMLHTCLEAAS